MPSVLPSTIASSLAGQVTGNTSLASIDVKLPASIGQKSTTGSLSVVFSSDFSNVVTGFQTGLSGVNTASTGYINVIQKVQYKSTLATLTDGQSIDQQGDANGKTYLASRTSRGMVNPTVSTSPAYSTGDVVGGLMTFTSMTDASSSGVVQSARVNTKTLVTAGLKMYLFHTNPTGSTFTDNAAPSIAAADYNKVFEVVSLPSPDNGLGTHTIWTANGIGRSFVLPSSGTTIYGVNIATTGFTLGTTTDLEASISVMKD